jgi:uracil-DNA glycosylase
METFQEINQAIVRCTLCPRLRSHCEKVAQIKKREFRDWEYWGKPVPGFGDARARLWIVGLAPAAHGGNRTGRMFTGDSSGRWLYDALYQTGFANQPTSERLDDGLVLKNAYVSAAARCAPPDNKPTPDEFANCERYLLADYHALVQQRLILALGAVAFASVLKILKKEGEFTQGARPQFGHGALHKTGKETLLCSYHPSRQNTQTGRLTQKMWLSIFERAAKIVGDGANGSAQRTVGP